MSRRKQKYQPNFTEKDFLPTTRAEMDALGWDQCDVILISGDAYIDSPFIGVAMVGRMLEKLGYKVGNDRSTRCQLRCRHQTFRESLVSTGASLEGLLTLWFQTTRQLKSFVTQMTTHPVVKMTNVRTEHSLSTVT